MISGINQVINNLRKVRNAINNDINSLFITKSLEWIRDRAIEILNTRLSNPANTFQTNVTDLSTWIIKQISKNSYILENTYENSASIEFGIGLVGQENPHNWAEEAHYEYNLPSDSKDENGCFVFKDKATGRTIGLKKELQNGKYVLVRYFSGYEGKSFLYNAFMEYQQNNIWVKKYQEAFDEIMRSVIK